MSNMKNKASINLNITNLKWSKGAFKWSSIKNLQPKAQALEELEEKKATLFEDEKHLNNAYMSMIVFLY